MNWNKKCELDNLPKQMKEMVVIGYACMEKTTIATSLFIYFSMNPN